MTTLFSQLYIIMIPIDCKITKFSLCLFLIWRLIKNSILHQIKQYIMTHGSELHGQTKKRM